MTNESTTATTAFEMNTNALCLLNEPSSSISPSFSSSAPWYDGLGKSPSPLASSRMCPANSSDTVESFIDAPAADLTPPNTSSSPSLLPVTNTEDPHRVSPLQVSKRDGALQPESLSPGASPCPAQLPSRKDFRRSRSPSYQHQRKRMRDRSPSHGAGKHDKVASSSFGSSSSPALVHTHKHHPRRSKFTDLPLEWWERGEDCKDAKIAHVDKIDYHCKSREFLVLQTTLWRRETALELNMFPYDTPESIRHYTLWSRKDLSHDEIVEFVDGWLDKHHPKVRRWQYDDNYGDRSILLFHVHVFVEMDPFSFSPRPGLEYFPPHMNIENDYPQH